MLTKLERIAEIAKEKPKEKFTSLIHLIDKEMLMQCHKEFKGNKAIGIDNMTKAEYEANLEENIETLLEKMKTFKANIYLYYVLDLWFEKVVRKRCKGQAYIVR